jgi:hypothetical protein
MHKKAVHLKVVEFNPVVQDASIASRQFLGPKSFKTPVFCCFGCLVWQIGKPLIFPENMVHIVREFRRCQAPNITPKILRFPLV